MSWRGVCDRRVHGAGDPPAPPASIPRHGAPDLAAVPGRPAHAIIARDFLVAGTVLLQRLCVLVFTGHGTRRLHPGGVTAHPAGARAVQRARNLAVDLGGRLETLRFLIHDRDRLFTAAFGEAFKVWREPSAVSSWTGS